jgi:ribose transport system substrate-binding protein
MKKSRQLHRLIPVAAVSALALLAAACSSSPSSSAAPSTSTSPSSASSSTPATSSASAAATASSASTASLKPLSSLSFTYGSAANSIGLIKEVGDSVVGDAKSVGIKITEYDNNLDGPTALNNAQLMVQDHPNVAIDWNTVVGVGDAVGAQFTHASIPCLSVNQEIAGCTHFNLSNKDMGLGAAAVMLPMAKQRGWNGSNTTVVMVIAAANGTEVNDGPRYFYVQTANVLSGFKKVSPSSITATTTTIGGTNGIQIDCKSTLDGAFTAMQNVIGSIPKNNNILLYGTDDDCDLGAYQSLKQNGFGSRILTGGLGGDPDGLNELRTNPSWVCEGSAFIQDWGPYILSEAVAMVNGYKPPVLTSSPQIMLTKQNLSTYYNKANNVILLPPLVSDNQYLAKYGLLTKFAKIQGLNS